ncbi:hypothetical protein MCETHM1_00132 [Flavobacteriaceae bacterium]
MFDYEIAISNKFAQQLNNHRIPMKIKYCEINTNK